MIVWNMGLWLVFYNRPVSFYSKVKNWLYLKSASNKFGARKDANKNIEFKTDNSLEEVTQGASTGKTKPWTGQERGSFVHHVIPVHLPISQFSWTYQIVKLEFTIN